MYFRPPHSHSFGPPTHSLQSYSVCRCRCFHSLHNVDVHWFAKATWKKKNTFSQHDFWAEDVGARWWSFIYETELWNIYYFWINSIAYNCGFSHGTTFRSDLTDIYQWIIDALSVFFVMQRMQLCSDSKDLQSLCWCNNSKHKFLQSFNKNFLVRINHFGFPLEIFERYTRFICLVSIFHRIGVKCVPFLASIGQED